MRIGEIPTGVINFNLRNWHIKSTDLNRPVNQSFTPERMENNIIKLDREHIDNILKAIY